MVIKRVSPLSCAKIAGLLYALMGLLIGAVISMVALAGGFAAAGDNDSFGPLMGAMMGAGAIIIAPICYGLLGFIGALIGAFIYNIAASAVGGIEIDVQ